MRSCRSGLLLSLAALPLAASTVSLSGQTEVLLHTGDALVFAFSSASYNANAARFGAPSTPSLLSLMFTTANIGSDWSLEGELRSLDGSAAFEIGDLEMGLGWLQTSFYTRSVSTAGGHVELSPELALKIFEQPSAVILLRNTGSAVSLGIPNTSLAQNLRVSLSGGNLNVGAPIIAVSLESAVQPDSFAADLGYPAPQNVPEPGALGLTATGALLIALGLGFRRFKSARCMGHPVDRLQSRSRV